jgi:hypothetical protein
MLGAASSLILRSEHNSPFMLRSACKARLEARGATPARVRKERTGKKKLGHDHPYASANWIRF